MATAKQVTNLARSQVGTTEIGYTNKVKYNDWYWGKGKYGSWAAWCSVFLAWCSDQAGMSKNVDYPYSAGVAVCFAWFRAKGRIVSKSNLRLGDWVRFTFSHTAFFLRKAGVGKIRTLEGNTSPGNSGSQRDGGGVYERTRPLGLIQYGGRPFYGKATTTTPTTPATPAKPKGLFGMALKAADSKTENRKIAKGKEITLRTRAKKAYSFLCSVKHGETVLVDADVRISALRDGQVAEVFLRLGEYVKKTGKTHTRYNYPRQTVIGRAGGGDVHVNYVKADKIQMKPKHGGDLRLYLVVKNVSGDECVVEYSKHVVLGD